MFKRNHLFFILQSIVCLSFPLPLFALYSSVLLERKEKTTSDEQALSILVCGEIGGIPTKATQQLIAQIVALAPDVPLSCLVSLPEEDSISYDKQSLSGALMDSANSANGKKYFQVVRADRTSKESTYFFSLILETAHNIVESLPADRQLTLEFIGLFFHIALDPELSAYLEGFERDLAYLRRTREYYETKNPVFATHIVYFIIDFLAGKKKVLELLAPYSKEKRMTDVVKEILIQCSSLSELKTLQNQYASLFIQTARPLCIVGFVDHVLRLVAEGKNTFLVSIPEQDKKDVVAVLENMQMYSSLDIPSFAIATSEKNLTLSVKRLISRSMRFCWNCSKKNPTKICSRCKEARYCNQDCQTKDWELYHKEFCKKNE